MKLLKRLPLLLVALLALVPLGPAYADAAPPVEPQLGGLIPWKFQNTQVQMVYERVEMEVQVVADGSADPQRDDGPSQIAINAYFVMHNQGTVDESMQVLFPLESFTDCENSGYYKVDDGSFQVYVDGAATTFEDVTTDNPYTKVCSPLKWASFAVTFPVNEDVVIQVKYMMVDGGWNVANNTIEYILETGAGWYGPIGTADIILRFPYLVDEDGTSTILSSTVTAYQTLQNEVYWYFTNIEPTEQDNIEVTFVNPVGWQRILQLKRSIQSDPSNVSAWERLGNLYNTASRKPGKGWIISPLYFNAAEKTFLEGIAANPLSARLNFDYAELWLNPDSCPYYSAISREPYINQCLPRGLPYFNRAVALDPQYSDAIGMVQWVLPDFTYTPPPTIPPTFTYTPSLTTTPSLTLRPPASNTPYSTRFRTWTPTASPTLRPTATPTITPSPTPVPWTAQFETGHPARAAALVLLALLTLGAGIFVNARMTRRKD